MSNKSIKSDFFENYINIISNPGYTVIKFHKISILSSSAAFNNYYLHGHLGVELPSNNHFINIVLYHCSALQYNLEKKSIVL